MDECWAAVALCSTTLPIFAMVDNSWCNRHLRLKQKETFLSSILISYDKYIYIYIYTPNPNTFEPRKFISQDKKCKSQLSQEVCAG